MSGKRRETVDELSGNCRFDARFDACFDARFDDHFDAPD